MTDAILIAFVKEVLLKDPDIIAKYGSKLAGLQHSPSSVKSVGDSNIAKFSDALDSPASPPPAEKQATKNWVPKPVPASKVVKADPSGNSKPAIVHKTIAAADRSAKPAPNNAAVNPKPAIVHKTIVAADPSAKSESASSANTTTDAALDTQIEMDTSVPRSTGNSDSEYLTSSDASSSEDDFQVVTGKKRKKGKASHANKAKKSVASSAAPAAATSVARSHADRPTSPIVTASASQKKQRPPPPLYIQDKGKWTNVSKMCSDRKINYTSAKACQQGIRVTVQSSADYRELVRSLRERNVSFHTYSLPEDIPTRVVIRRIPKEIDSEDIKADLIAQSINVSAVHRLHKARGGDLYDMVLVVCDHVDGHHPIFNIKSVCSLTGIKVETAKRPTIMGQCHRCQIYGHSQSNCYAKPRCVKCLGDHGTAHCSRLKDPSQCTELPSCVLCGQAGHTANYKGRPKAPKVAPKIAKRAAARHLREAPSDRKVPSSEMPERLAPQRTSPWNRLNHEKAFPALKSIQVV